MVADRVAAWELDCAGVVLDAWLPTVPWDPENDAENDRVASGGRGEPEVLGVSNGNTLANCDWVPDCVERGGTIVADGVALWDLDFERLCELLELTTWDSDRDNVLLEDCDDVQVWLDVGLWVGLNAWLPLADTEQLAGCVELPVAIELAVVEGLGVRELVAEGLGVTVSVEKELGVSVPELVAAWENVVDRLWLDDKAWDMDRDCDSVRAWVDVTDWLAVPPWLAEDVWLLVSDSLAVAAWLAENDCDGVAVRDAVLERVDEALSLGLPEGLGVTERLEVCDAVPV
jgi:hypothetical protein